MDKLRSGASRVTGLFKRDNDGLHSVLQKKSSRSSRSDPFVDGPTMEEPSLPSSHMWIHFATLFFNFLAICTLGASAGIQAHWFGVSGGTGFTIFLLIVTFLLTSFLVTVPLVYDRWDKLRRPAQFLSQARTVLILHAFGSLMIIIAAMIVTISAFGAAGCKNADDDPHASLGDEFKSELGQWCNTKKACGVFIWLASGGWLGLTGLAVLAFRRERRREPGFIPPSSPGGMGASAASMGIGYSHVPGRETYGLDGEGEKDHNGDGDEERDVGTYNRRGHGGYEGRMEPAQSTGAAFPLSVGGDSNAGGARMGGSDVSGAGPSRTMQMAYTDPYAQVRQSLLQGTYNHPSTSTPPPIPVSSTPAPQLQHQQYQQQQQHAGYDQYSQGQDQAYTSTSYATSEQGYFPPQGYPQQQQLQHTGYEAQGASGGYYAGHAAGHGHAQGGMPAPPAYGGGYQR